MEMGMCKCLFKIDAVLESRQQQVKRVVRFSNGTMQLSNAIVATEWRGDKKPRGKKLVNLFANYCPFCGIALEQAEPGGEE